MRLLKIPHVKADFLGVRHQKPFLPR